MAILIVLLIVFALVLWKYMFYRPKNFPPGPPRIPLLGSYPFLCLINEEHLYKASIWLGKFYKSNVIGLYLGQSPVVISLDKQSVRSVLTESDFDGRPVTFASRLRDPERKTRGIFFTESSFWKDQRWFFLRHLRDFGFGRRFTELEIGLTDELQGFVEMIREGPKYNHESQFMDGKGIICAPNIFFGYYSNAFLRIVTGRSVPREDREGLLNLGLQGMAFHKYSEVYGRLLNIIPFIRHLLPGWCGYNKILQSNRIFYKFVAEIVDTELEAYLMGEEGRNFIHLYADQMEIAKEKLVENPAYHREQLIMALVNFLFAAITTVPAQTAFLLQHLLLNPKCVAIIQAELDDVVGRGRMPTLDDRVHLSYTEAAIREVMRLETIAHTAIGHRAVKDSKLEGYDVKEGTSVFATLYALNRDAGLWGKDVDQFKPERFLDKNGKLSLKMDQSLPFGHAGRLCPGETFARNTFFLVTTALLQNFNINLPENETIDLNKTVGGFIRYPSPFWVKVTER